MDIYSPSYGHLKFKGFSYAVMQQVWMWVLQKAAVGGCNGGCSI